MSWLSKLLGRNPSELEATQSQVQSAAPGPGTQPKATSDNAPARGKVRWLTANGIYATEVVGEQHYRVNLERLCGPTTGTNDLRTVADLVPEANNPHDANAVRVDIDGLTVGYLDREDAVAFRKQLRRVIEVGRPIKCEARVRRKDHEGNRTYYDVYLEADLGD